MPPTTTPLAFDDSANWHAPVLVLLGSLGSRRTMWEPQVTALGSEFRMITVDLRGHGDSPTPPGPYAMADLAGDVLELLDQLELEAVHIAGLSLGGAIAQQLGTDHPDRVRSLTLLCTSARFGVPSAWHERAALVRAQGTSAVAESVVDRWFTPEFAAANPGLIADTRAMVAGTDPEGYAASCEAIADWDHHPHLHKVTAPTLVIAGQQDPSTGPEQLRLIADSIPHARLQVLDPAAHLANIEQAEAVTELLRTHVRAAENSGA